MCAALWKSIELVEIVLFSVIVFIFSFLKILLNVAVM